jgi:hypothetical protein
MVGAEKAARREGGRRLAIARDEGELGQTRLEAHRRRGVHRDRDDSDPHAGDEGRDQLEAGRVDEQHPVAAAESLLQGEVLREMARSLVEGQVGVGVPLPAVDVEKAVERRVGLDLGPVLQGVADRLHA